MPLPLWNPCRGHLGGLRGQNSWCFSLHTGGEKINDPWNPSMSFVLWAMWPEAVGAMTSASSLSAIGCSGFPSCTAAKKLTCLVLKSQVEMKLSSLLWALGNNQTITSLLNSTQEFINIWILNRPPTFLHSTLLHSSYVKQVGTN